MIPITYAVERSVKYFMTVPVIDPISKIFQKFKVGRKSKRRLKMK